MRKLIYFVFKWSTGFQHRVSRRLTKSGKLVLGAAFAFAVIGLDTNLTMAYQAFTFLAALLLTAIIWSTFFSMRFTSIRELPQVVTANTSFTYSIYIHNQTRRWQKGLFVIEHIFDPRPTYEEFINQREPEESKRNFFDRLIGFYRWQWLVNQNNAEGLRPYPLPPIPPNGEEKAVMRLQPYHRGSLHLTAVTIARPDPLGLVYAMRTNPLPQSLTVLAHRYNLPSIELTGARQYQSGGVALALSVGDTEEFRTLRDYRPGDSPRHIHWKSWAKTDRPVVKEFQAEFYVRHALVLDTFTTDIYSIRFEEAVSVASSLACTLQTQESLLDLMFVGNHTYCFTSGRGVSHTTKMLEILAAVQICHDHPFSMLSAKVLSRVFQLSSIICVFIHWDEQRKALIDKLTALKIPLRVLLITDPADSFSGEPKFSPQIPPEVYVLHINEIPRGLAQL